MRARNIKPGFFCNEELVELSPACRLLFIGLWCFADREGRFEARTTKIKMAIFPGESHDIQAMLADLTRTGFLHFYEVQGRKYYQINNFGRHQRPHKNEQASTIPPMDGQSTTMAVPEHNHGSCRDALNEECGMRIEDCGKRNEVLTHPAPAGESERPVLVPPIVAGQDRSETDPDIQNARLHYLQGKPKCYEGTVAHPETREAIRAWRAVPRAPRISDREAERLSRLVLTAEGAANAQEVAEKVAANEFCRQKMPFPVAMRPKNLQDILGGAYPPDAAPETGSGSISEATRLRFIHGGAK